MQDKCVDAPPVLSVALAIKPDCVLRRLHTWFTAAWARPHAHEAAAAFFTIHISEPPIIYNFLRVKRVFFSEIINNETSIISELEEQVADFDAETDMQKKRKRKRKQKWRSYNLCSFVK